MFSIINQRLNLIPLNLNQLQLLRQDYHLLEQAIGLEPFGLKISDPAFEKELLDAIHSYVIPKVSENEAHFQWFTLWFIVYKADNRSVGAVGITGLPNKQGEVLIGYFTDARYEGQGIMTEAVQLLVTWIFENPDVQSIIADTLIDGFASQKVLQKNGFVQDGTTDEGLRWRRKR